MSDVNEQRLQSYKDEAVKAVDMAYQAGFIDKGEINKAELAALRKKAALVDPLCEALGKMIDEYCTECDYGYVADNQYICSEHNRHAPRSLKGGCAVMKPYIDAVTNARAVLGDTTEADDGE